MPKKQHKNVTKDDKLLEKDPDTEEYALVTKKLGGGRFMLKLNMRDQEVIGRLCGKMKWRRNKRKNFVEVDSVVLVGMRDFQDNIVDIIHVYDQSEIRQLKKTGEFIEEQRLDYDEQEEQDDVFDFDEI